MQTLTRNESRPVMAWVYDKPSHSQPMLWNVAQVPLQAQDYRDYQVQFYVIRGPAEYGYITIDDIVMMPSPHCKVVPDGSEPIPVLGRSDSNSY